MLEKTETRLENLRPEKQRRGEKMPGILNLPADGPSEQFEALEDTRKAPRIGD